MLVPTSIEEGSEWRKTVDGFKTDYKAAYNAEANTFSGHGWDAATIMTDAMTRAIKEDGDQEKLSATVIRDQIEKTEELQGIAGAFTYTPKDHDGLSMADLVMIKIVNGAWTEAKSS
jgi:branched-chain amino acid transport system substrate-binding protein